MIICPSCATAGLNAESGRCAHCNWQRLETAGIEDYLTDTDRKSDMFANYTKTYEGLAQTNIEKSNIDRRFLRNQAKNLVKYLGNVRGFNACDIGIGQGFLCDELLRAGVERINAVDVAISYLQPFKGKSKVKPFLANAEHLPFKDEFDLITSTDVMEHVINVGSFLYCVNRALRIGGTAAIRVPYREGLLEYSPHRQYGHSFGHVRSFNKDILRIYMTQAGFEVRSFHLDGFSLGSPHTYLYNSPRRKGWYHKFYNYWNKRLEHPADSTLMNPRFAGLFMRPVEIVVIAKKTAQLAQ
jgi:SAM-dependent methyltransferase